MKPSMPPFSMMVDNVTIKSSVSIRRFKNRLFCVRLWWHSVASTSARMHVSINRNAEYIRMCVRAYVHACVCICVCLYASLCVRACVLLLHRKQEYCWRALYCPSPPLSFLPSRLPSQCPLESKMGINLRVREEGGSGSNAFSDASRRTLDHELRTVVSKKEKRRDPPPLPSMRCQPSCCQYASLTLSFLRKRFVRTPGVIGNQSG